MQRQTKKTDGSDENTSPHTVFSQFPEYLQGTSSLSLCTTTQGSDYYDPHFPDRDDLRLSGYTQRCTTDIRQYQDLNPARSFHSSPSMFCIVVQNRAQLGKATSWPLGHGGLGWDVSSLLGRQMSVLSLHPHFLRPVLSWGAIWEGKG